MHNSDLRKAILFTIGIGVLALAAVLLPIAVAFGDENDGAVGMDLQIKKGSLPSLNDCGYDRAHVPADHTDPNDAVLVAYSGSCFTHVYFQGGDAVGCVFTEHPTGGGRPCYNGVNNDNNCGYFAEGYQIYAIADSCTNAGVPICGGLGCY